MGIPQMEPSKVRVVTAMAPVATGWAGDAYNDRSVISSRGGDISTGHYSREERFGLANVNAVEECFVWGTRAVFRNDDPLEVVVGVVQASFDHACVIAALLYYIVTGHNYIH